jgi:predicted metal-dependent peptidase
MHAEGQGPFGALEEAARRQRAEEQALRAVAAARCRLVLGTDARSAFLATLALRLVPGVDWAVPTMAADGRSLALNPEFVMGLAADELLACVAHEVMHSALGHHARRGHRDPRRWNVACDLAINPILLDAGFTLPAGRLLPGEGAYADLPCGRSAEEYYELLPDPPGRGTPQESRPNADDAGAQPSSAGADPGGCGAVIEPAGGSPAEVRRSEAEWREAVAQAEQVARQRGTLPAGLARSIEVALHAHVDWREVLRSFVSSCARNDYAWSPPNRRFIQAGLYLPSLRSEELGEIVLAVDTSGSVGPEDLARFAAEAQAILESFDCTLTILYHDAEVQQVQRWGSWDGPLKLEPVGGGGTSHVCVFEWVAAHADDPTCVVCLTDLYTEFPGRAPLVPVLWAVVGTNSSPPPFGVRVDIHD